MPTMAGPTVHNNEQLIHFGTREKQNMITPVKHVRKIMSACFVTSSHLLQQSSSEKVFWATLVVIQIHSALKVR